MDDTDSASATLYTVFTELYIFLLCVENAQSDTDRQLNIKRTFSFVIL